MISDFNTCMGVFMKFVKDSFTTFEKEGRFK